MCRLELINKKVEQKTVTVF